MIYIHTYIMLCMWLLTNIYSLFILLIEYLHCVRPCMQGHRNIIDLLYISCLVSSLKSAICRCSGAPEYLVENQHYFA